MSGFLALLPEIAALAGAPATLASAAADAAAQSAAPAAAHAPKLQMDLWTAVAIVVLVGFLPTEVWRMLALIAGRQVEEGSELFHWVKAVATALLAAVVARLVFAPTGLIVAVPLALRLAALGGGVLAFYLVRRSVFAGVLAGELILIAAAAYYLP
ncbi:AzlD domain-containing protein [Xanthobacter pseudotagetidis]|uniref:AzlD domain-containing protein n=1 Tax=Xanthobacter pseudotagetidis TaxID=3119911 RepID=UPI003728E626